ncbi:hypothetical protein [uncultured Desulfovibrio sp.]|uniref:hypothetical protein n=1 Tax=uncultured Desulfovibrio sp. TaxID=167968 RepID=UPI00262E17EB|nr:hypothetical protein [uncultured Desulfovibrio sp.]
MTHFAILYLPCQQPHVVGILRAVYDKICTECLRDRLFYDGSARSCDAFLDEMLRPGCLPFVVMADQEPAAFAWCNHLEIRAARVHFVIFRKFWGRKCRTDMGRRFFRYLLTLRDTDGYLFDCLYGVTPESHPLAWKAALETGWRHVGIIPHFVFLADRQESVGGVITAVNRQALGMAENATGEARWDA